MYTHYYIYIKYIPNKDLLHRSGNCPQYSAVACEEDLLHRSGNCPQYSATACEGEEFEKEQTHSVAVSLCCVPSTKQQGASAVSQHRTTQCSINLKLGFPQRM